MFSLLRRSTKKKKKSTPEKSPKAARYSARASEERAGSDNSTNTTSRPIERYRSYNEWQRERELACEKETAPNEHRRGRTPPTQPNISNKTHSSVKVKDRDDLKDFEAQQENVYRDNDGDDNEASGVESRSPNARGISASKASGSSEEGLGQRYVYFRSQNGDGERDRKVEAKLNLATNNNKSLNNNAVAASIYTTALANEQTETISATGKARRGGRVAAVVGIAPSAIPIKAATFRINDLATKSDFNVDIINKRSTESNKLAVSSNDDEYECHGCDRVERSAALRGAHDTADWGECKDTLARGDSPNEEAGRQRRLLSLTDTKKSKNKNDRFANRSIIDLDQPYIAPQLSRRRVDASNAAPEAGHGEYTVEAAASNAISTRRNSNKGKEFSAIERELAAAKADLANSARTNEVKYRNLTNPTDKTAKVQKNSVEAKRQSRLSLTLAGLNLKGARSKSITDISTSVSNRDSSTAAGSYYSGSSSYSGRGQSKRSALGKAFRYSFLRGRSKSSDTETTFEEDEFAIEKSDVSGRAAYGACDGNHVVSGSGSKALKKGKEFFSDLFMARGRNQNRNRNSQTHTQSTNTPQNTQTQTQPTQQVKQNKQQKQQQVYAQEQQLAQFQRRNQQQQQQKQQQQQQQQKHQQPQSRVKDVHSTCSPVSAPANHNSSNTPPLCNYQQENNNTHNNSGPPQATPPPVVVMQNVQNNSASTHLEVISADPLASSSTNTYQITMSNNSRNISEINQAIYSREHSQRSNSAGEEQQLSVGEANRNEVNSRSRSADPERRSVGDAGARSERKRANGEETAQRRLLQAGRDSESGIIRETNVELNGANKAASTESKISETFSNETVHGKGKEEKERVFESVENSKCSETPRSLFPITPTNTAEPQLSENNNRSEPRELPSLYAVCSRAAPMGQTSAKPSENAASTSASASRDLHAPNANTVNASDVNSSVPVLPKITVVDCSNSRKNGEDNDSIAGSPAEQEIFYDFENDVPTNNRAYGGVEISDLGKDSDHEDAVQQNAVVDEVFHEQDIPATIYQQKWPLRYNHTRLENVPEQEENEEKSEDAASESGSTSDADSHTESAAEEAAAAGAVCEGATKINSANNLDTESDRHYHRESADRGALPKSANTSDSNLSSSYTDSGIGGMDSRCSSTSSPSRQHSSSDNETRAARSTKSGSPTVQHHHSNSNNNHNNNNNSNYFKQRHAQLSAPPHRRCSPFARDGNSTDCDDTLLQCDDLEYIAEDADPNERLVCIESISLPDVVVESTTGASGGANASASISSTGDANANNSSDSGGGGGEHIININGATGNTMGNVHIIPIHVEGQRNDAPTTTTPKRRSVDDSILGSGGGINKSFVHLNGMHQKSTVEITEDGSELTYDKTTKGYGDNSNANDATVEKLRRELTEQKSRYSTQIGDAQKNVQNLQDKVATMQEKIQKLEQELSAKAWNVERLQSELQAAQTDDDFVRKRLKLLEEEKTSLRHKYSENEDEFRRKYDELETQYNELETKYKETKQLASHLQTQLATAQSEAEEWRKEAEKIRGELEAQITVLKNALENSEAERKICQDKWQKEFEMLRTQNRDREETVMADCEWQLRQIQRQAKDKNDKLEHERQLAAARAEELQSELEERKQEVEGLKVYQAEVKSLRGVVTEQEQAIKTLMEQIGNMRCELQTANANLEEQMKAVKKIKNQCDNALCDKEREVVYRINEVRNQAAVFWEDKLYTEMTRLKNELESVYVDERREALDKLQAEHIEELRALTTRYTANEDELRIELNELHERLERKSEEFIEMRDKSDNTLLQMRMHLDRADREYQNAMCREEERRETLEENLRKEFQTEREEMEEKFRERLSQVKEEFAKELQDATQEMRQKHEKDLEQQKCKLLAERDEALQELSERHRQKLAAVDEKIKDIELRHQHDLKDLKAAYDTEKAAMDRRDISNTNEIEQLHRKCRCLTNLFEEMRMRYERRDPRQEDLREIEELRTRCESQERDLFELTDRLREMQIQMTAMQQQQQQQAGSGDASGKSNKAIKQVKKPPPKTIPTNCDVIYEDENEERESPPPQTTTNGDDDEDEEEDEEEEEEEEGEGDVEQQYEA